MLNQLQNIRRLLAAPSPENIRTANSELAKLPAAQPDDRKLVDELFMRVLNRPAGESETAKVLENWGVIDGDHSALLAQLDTKEKEQAPIIAKERGKETHEVKVLSQGFEYRGETYRSLSKIAREITGTRWSGPLFFGLKTSRSEEHYGTR